MANEEVLTEKDIRAARDHLMKNAVPLKEWTLHVGGKVFTSHSQDDCIRQAMKWYEKKEK